MIAAIDCASGSGASPSSPSRSAKSDSQHTAGPAADVFVDEEPDGRMEDLDRDGAVTRDDAVWLFQILDGMERTPGAPFRVGLGDYGSTAAHGPFVHVDVRGRLARWRG